MVRGPWSVCHAPCMMPSQLALLPGERSTTYSHVLTGGPTLSTGYKTLPPEIVRGFLAGVGSLAFQHPVEAIVIRKGNGNAQTCLTARAPWPAVVSLRRCAGSGGRGVVRAGSARYCRCRSAAGHLW